MAPTPSDIDTILAEITTASSLTALAHTLRSLPKESRDLIFASSLSTGQDPLEVLDVRVNTLGVLWILSSRLTIQGAHPPSWDIVKDFCARFDPEQARAAPDRVTMLAKGIHGLARESDNAKQAIVPLRNLMLRYPLDPSHLTPIHPLYAMACLTTHHLPAPPVPSSFAPSTTTSDDPTLPLIISPSPASIAPDLSYTDNLLYHYAAACILTLLGRYTEAEDFFETCVTAPGSSPSAVQLEAVKKLRLVQLVARGEISPLPKYTHPALQRTFKSSPYQAFVNAYPHNTQAMREVVDKERAAFGTDKNLGLINQAIARAPRWVLKKLTATYLSLSLSDIARAVGIGSEEEVRALLVNMIESSDINASLSASGTVTFFDPIPQIDRAQVDSVLAAVQKQTEELGILDGEVGRGKEFLSKVMKNRDDGTWAPSAEEDIYPHMGSQNAWEESIFS